MPSSTGGGKPAPVEELLTEEEIAIVNEDARPEPPGGGMSTRDLLQRQRGQDEANGRLYARLIADLIRQARDDLDAASWDALKRMIAQEVERDV